MTDLKTTIRGSFVIATIPGFSRAFTPEEFAAFGSDSAVISALYREAEEHDESVQGDVFD